MSEKLNLKWNNFHTNVSKSFSLLREEDYLQDVTLVTDEKKQMSAHKLVLSACSEYFKSIFQNNKKHSHPVICLPGLDCDDLKHILDYMYNGEVQIYQEQIDRFLKVAKKFKLEGLLESKSYKEEVKVPQVLGSTTCSTSTVPFVKEETILEEDHDEEPTEGTAKIESISSNITEIEEQINQYFERCEDGLYRCTLCGKTGKQSRNVKNHIEIHIDGLEFPCDKCDKMFRSRNLLSNHISRVHRNNSKPF